MPDVGSIVEVAITRETKTPTRQAFSVPLIAAPFQSTSFPNRVRTYSSLAAMKTDGMSASSPAYLAAAAMKAQNPSIQKWKVGRRDHVPAETFTLQVLDQGAVVGELFDFKVDGSSVLYTVTSTSKTTVATILSGLIDAISGPSATSSGDTITITREVSGTFGRIQDWPRRLCKIKNTTPITSSNVSDDLDAIAGEDGDWYVLLMAEQSKGAIEAAAAWAESADLPHLQIYDLVDSECLDPNSTGDGFYVLKNAGYNRSAGIFNGNDTQAHPAAAWAGRMLAAYDPGEATWKFKSLNGISADNLSDSDVAALEGKNASYYVSIGGLKETFGDAKVASGEYVDVIQFLDWLKSQMQLRIFATLSNLPKVPYTDTGLDVIRNDVLAVLDEGVQVGGLAGGSTFVEMPKVADVDPLDKGDRILRDVKWGGELAGAVHKVLIDGTVTV